MLLKVTGDILKILIPLFIIIFQSITFPQVTVRDTLIEWHTFKYSLNSDNTIIQSTSILNDTVAVNFKGTVIENEFLKITLLPEYGGRILSMIYKPTGHEELYQNPAGAPYGIGQGWFYYDWLMVYGGIFPTLSEPEHGKAWMLPWKFEFLKQTADTVRCKMTWVDTVMLKSADPGKWKYGQTGIKCEYIVTIAKGSSALEADIILYNDHNFDLDYEYWTCLTLAPGSKSGEPKTTHGSEIFVPVSKIKIPSWYPDIASKEKQVPGKRGIYYFDKLKDWYNWSSDGIAYAWDDKTPNFWGVINHDNGEGLIRISENVITPGVKIWAWDYDQSQNIDPFLNPENVKRPYIELWAGHSKEFFEPAYFSANTKKSWKEIYAPTVGLSNITHVNKDVLAEIKIADGSNCKEAHLNFSTLHPLNMYEVKIEITGDNPQVLLTREVAPDAVNGNKISINLPCDQTWGDEDSLKFSIVNPSAMDSLCVSLPLKNVNTFIAEDKEMPSSFSLYQNYPNPFNPETIIQYTIAKPVYVSLKVYNILGDEVAVLVNEFKSAGTYKLLFDAKKYSLSSGVYFYTMHSQEFIKTLKFTLIK